MTNDRPNECVLVMYKAWAFQHELTLAQIDADAGHELVREDVGRDSEVLAVKYKAETGLRVIKALIGSWHHDDDARRKQRERWEADITKRYEHLRK